MGRTNAAARYRELGAELRKRRESVGLTGAELADRTGWSPTKISRIESGQRHIDLIELVQYLGYCGIFRPQALDLMALWRDTEHGRGYWLSPYGQWLEDSLASLIYHETTAARTTIYEPLVVAGLMQTRDYARAWIAAEQWRTTQDVDRCVQIRMERQRILRTEHPARFTFFLHEHALHLEVGSAAVMHEQLLKIVLLSALDHLTVRIVPASAGDHSAFGGQFHLYEYAEHRPLVYLDNHASVLFLEDREYVDPYRGVVSAMSKVALDGGQSRELIATLASEYDRGSKRDAGHLEEEQLQRRWWEELRRGGVERGGVFSAGLEEPWWGRGAAPGRGLGAARCRMGTCSRFMSG